jgi:transcriptional regulator with XRE-family HTH domain
MPGEPITIKFGLRVRTLRERQGYSQEGFADACGLHRTYVGAIERGEKAVTIVTAEKLALALGLRLAALFDGI